MGWDCELFKPKNNISKEEKVDEKTSPEKRFVQCTDCNELISVVSVTLYEIEEKHYCSECYSQKIINMAVERDHSDLKREKGSQRKKLKNKR
jgi:hypothetical protein